MTKVLGTKDNGGDNGKHFVVVDAAMNDLIRPSFYQAYHHILPIKDEKVWIIFIHFIRVDKAIIYNHRIKMNHFCSISLDLFANQATFWLRKGFYIRSLLRETYWRFVTSVHTGKILKYVITFQLIFKIVSCLE